MNEIISRIDLTAVLDQVDLNHVLARIDVTALLDRVDVDSLLDRTDLNGVIERVDIDAVMRRGGVGGALGPRDGHRHMNPVAGNGLMERARHDALASPTRTGVSIA